jgi:hypothetical protein
LGFEADNIGFERRADDTERNRFGDGNNQQRAFGVSDFGNCRNIFDDAEEVRALHENGGGFAGNSRVERGEINASGFAVVADERGGQALLTYVGGQHLAVLGMNGGGDDGLAAAGDANGHDHGFGCAG